MELSAKYTARVMKCMWRLHQHILCLTRNVSTQQSEKKKVKWAVSAEQSRLSRSLSASDLSTAKPSANQSWNIYISAQLTITVTGQHKRTEQTKSLTLMMHSQ